MQKDLVIQQNRCMGVNEITVEIKFIFSVTDISRSVKIYNKMTNIFLL